jgi:hypothetical protein
MKLSDNLIFNAKRFGAIHSFTALIPETTKYDHQREYGQ